MKRGRNKLLEDYIKANRKGSRDSEMENDGKFKSTIKIHKSVKTYIRKQKHKNNGN